jgi:hypothetical protein
MENINIIVSRYNEDLKWTLEEPFNKYKYIVYNKGINENFEKKNVAKVINIKNVGREGHTYLYHIISNYNNLSDILIFFPGSLDMSHKKVRGIELLQRIEKNNYKKAIFISNYCNNLYVKFKNFKIDNWSSTNESNFKINRESKLKLSNIRPYGYWYKYYFGNKISQFHNYCGIFSVDKKDIIQHNIKRYIVLINQLNSHSNPEVGHYIERSWGAIFQPFNNTKVLLN